MSFNRDAVCSCCFFVTDRLWCLRSHGRTVWLILNITRSAGPTKGKGEAQAPQ